MADESEAAPTRRIIMTKAKREAFLATLGESANVMQACREAGILETSVYKLRRRDEAFRAAWLEALDEGYAKLETMTLDWAMNGVPKPVATGRRTVMRRQVSERLALSLLTRHAAAIGERRARIAAAAASGPHAADAFAAFRASLELIAERLAAAPCPRCDGRGESAGGDAAAA